MSISPVSLTVTRNFTAGGHTPRNSKPNIEYDYVWVVATVGRRKNSYALRVREPKTLAPNQFAYRLRIPFDREQWQDRIAEVELTEVEPPKLPEPQTIETLVEKDTPQRVLDSLVGRDDGEE